MVRQVLGTSVSVSSLTKNLTLRSETKSYNRLFPLHVSMSTGAEAEMLSCHCHFQLMPIQLQLALDICWYTTFLLLSLQLWKYFENRMGHCKTISYSLVLLNGPIHFTLSQRLRPQYKNHPCVSHYLHYLPGLWPSYIRGSQH